ncbi:MAG: Crp/Fnr family transcriptional regulator [Pelobacteraceae bacterium]
MENKYWYIKRSDIFSVMSHEEMERLASLSTMCEFKKGATIYLLDEPSEHVYLLKEGTIKISRLGQDGQEIILDIVAPGEIFGEMSLLGEDSRSTMAQATEDSLICSIRKGDFFNFFSAHNDLAFKVLKLVGLKRVEIETRLEELAYCSVFERIALLLTRMAKRHGVVVVDGGIKIRPRLTHRDIAFLVGASRETVTEQLNQLKAQGLIDTSFMCITIRNPDALEQLVTER